MNRDRYHAAFDGIQFRRAFEEETVQLLLEAAGQQQEKERSSMKVKHFKKTALIAAVLAVAVMATAAAVNLLHPAQVAEYMGHPALADAFNSEDAILLNESKEFGDFTVTLMGVTSGAHLSDVYEDADAARSYIVAAMSRIDGESIDYADLQGIMVTPLVAGYQPWEVNNFTLGGGYESVIADGMHTAYYIFECGSLEPFADHTIYLACCEGVAPSSDMLQLNQDGSISFLDSYTKPHALFTLPLDSAKADPVKAAAIVDQIRQPSPEAPEEALGDTGDGDVENIVITEEYAARALEQQ